MKKIPNWLRYSLVLLLLGMFSGGILAYFNALTSEIIEKIVENEMIEVLNDKLPEYKDFNCDDISNTVPEKEKFKYVYKYSSGEDIKAVVYFINTKGYQNGLISILITIDYETSKVVQFTIIDAKDQMQKIFETDYNLLGADIDAFNFTNMAGVTVSSNAIYGAVNIVAEHYMNHFKNEIGGN